MNDIIFKWKGYEWITRERWGDLHPEKPYARYSSDCVKILRDDTLSLEIGDNDNGVWRMGLISSTENNPVFSYGKYDFTAKLPKGRHLWPALWMWGMENWPPELDVMEAWTNDNGGYLLRDVLNTHITTCVHYGKNNIHSPNFLKLFKCIFRIPYLFFNTYSMVWKPDEIKFLFNGKTTFIFDDKKALEWINNNSNGGMNIILNLYPTKDYKKGDMKKPLLVKDFKYTPL